MAETQVRKFIRIQSKMTILVTPGLQLSDYTDEKKAVANKLNIKPRWQAGSIQIKEGAHYYPAEIAKWNTVKALVEKEILTLGEITENIPDKLQDETNKTAAKFDKGQKDMNTDLAQRKQKKLADI